MNDDLDFAPVKPARRGPKLIAFGLILAFAATVAAGAVMEPPHRSAIRRLNAAGATVMSSDGDRDAGWLSWLDPPRQRYQVFWKGGFGCIMPPFYAPGAEKPRPIQDDDLAAIRAIGTVTSLDLEDQAIGDAALAPLRGLRGLAVLNLTATRITEASIPVIESLPDLSSLIVAETAIGDAALKQLKARRPELHIETARLVRYKGG